MFVKITQATHEYSGWYKDLVGKVFEVLFTDEKNNSHVIDNIDGTGNLRGCIFFEDCEEIEEITEENKFIIPPKPKSQLEILQETIDALILASL